VGDQRAGQSELKETKTDSDRRLSLDPLTVQMLTDFHEQLSERLAPGHLTLAEDAYVFSPDPAGLCPWHPDHFTHTFRELADLVGITEPLKNLRQFNATQLLSAGVDLRTTAGRLGHSDGGATTLKVYADWMPATDRKAAKQLSDDLTALRAAQTAKAGGGETVAAPALRRVSRPLEEILEPAADGRTTYLVVVVAALKSAIGAGRLEPGDLVPTVDQLSAWFGIARSTAQRAFAVLGGRGADCAQWTAVGGRGRSERLWAGTRSCTAELVSGGIKGRASPASAGPARWACDTLRHRPAGHPAPDSHVNVCSTVTVLSPSALR